MQASLSPLARTTLVLLARTGLTLAGVVLLVFAVVRAVPGDPALAILGEQARPEDLARLREQMGLTRPLVEQFTGYLTQILDGSLGRPFSRGGPEQTVSGLLLEVLPYTVELALSAVLIACLLALPLGVLSALRRDRPADRLVLVGTLLGVAMPGFWLGPLLIHLFCVRLGWLPDPGAGVRGVPSLVLPALVLGLALSAKLARMTRSSVLDVLQQPYVTAAYSRGISGASVLVRHVLRNALVPIVTVLGMQFAALLAGAIVTEKVFARPGVGTLLLDGIAARDYAVIQGTALHIGAAYVGVNLVFDLLYGVVDPRIRLSGPTGWR